MATFRLDDLEPNLHATAWVHASAQVIGDVVLAREVSVWPSAVIRGDYGRISIGWGSNVQDGAVLHTRGNEPTVVGADCVVGHLAHLESCIVEDVVLVGSTAVVLPGAVLRTGSMVAAGAVVTPGMEVPTGHRAQGVPARLVRAPVALEDEIRELAARYRRNAVRHRDRCVELPPPAYHAALVDCGHPVQGPVGSGSPRPGSTT